MYMVIFTMYGTHTIASWHTHNENTMVHGKAPDAKITVKEEWPLLVKINADCL